jgi:hypothetical protein
VIVVVVLSAVVFVVVVGDGGGGGGSVAVGGGGSVGVFVAVFVVTKSEIRYNDYELFVNSYGEIRYQNE